MTFKMVFKRHEMKYLMDAEQTKAVYKALNEHMKLDNYGHSTIRNIYFDTDSYLLVRRSIEKPLYKEKLRFRCYGETESDGDVFVELKKKHDSVVYKRRLTMPLDKAMSWFDGGSEDFPHTQIGEEIDFFRSRYPGIHPAMLLTYEREAYTPKDGSDLRITIDSNIRARTEDVRLDSELGGHSILPDGYMLMEVKTMYGLPRWLLDVMNHNGLYKTSFSKYGSAYKEMILGRMPECFARIPNGMSTVVNCNLPRYGNGPRDAIETESEQPIAITIDNTRSSGIGNNGLIALNQM